MKDPLQGLGLVPWDQLETAGGQRATRLAEVLRELAETKDAERWMEVYSALPMEACLTHSHGPYVSEATAPAVPFVAALLPLAPDIDCLSCLLVELRDICASIETRAEDLQDLSPWPQQGVTIAPREIERQTRFRQQSRKAVIEELARIKEYADHPDAGVRALVYDIARWLPDGWPVFSEVLPPEIEQERDDQARLWLLLALDGEAAGKTLGRMPLELLMTQWQEASTADLGFLAAYLLVLRLRDEAPSGCFPVVVRALWRGGISYERLEFSVREAAHVAYLPLRGTSALDAVLELLEQFGCLEQFWIAGLALHGISGSCAPSPWHQGNVGPRRRSPLPRLEQRIAVMSLKEQQKKALRLLVTRDWFWPWGGELLEAYGLPGTRDELLLRLG